MRPDARTMPLWARMYLQVFHRPADFDPEGMETFFSLELGEWNRERMADTVRWMGSEGQNWGKYPNGKTLAIAYKKFSRHGGAVDAARPTTTEGLLNFVKARMRDAAHDVGPEAAWNIMCSAKSYCGAFRDLRLPEIDEVYAWAQAERVMPAGWRPDFEAWAAETAELSRQRSLAESDLHLHDVAHDLHEDGMDQIETDNWYLRR